LSGLLSVVNPKRTNPKTRSQARETVPTLAVAVQRVGVEGLDDGEHDSSSRDYRGEQLIG
jgi:hypothetical protein